jgi:hypothetical protein
VTVVAISPPPPPQSDPDAPVLEYSATELAAAAAALAIWDVLIPKGYTVWQTLTNVKRLEMFHEHRSECICVTSVSRLHNAISFSFNKSKRYTDRDTKRV